MVQRPKTQKKDRILRFPHAAPGKFIFSIISVSFSSSPSRSTRNHKITALPNRLRDWTAKRNEDLHWTLPSKNLAISMWNISSYTFGSTVLSKGVDGWTYKKNKSSESAFKFFLWIWILLLLIRLGNDIANGRTVRYLASKLEVLWLKPSTGFPSIRDPCSCFLTWEASDWNIKFQE